MQSESDYTRSAFIAKKANLEKTTMLMRIPLFIAAVLLLLQGCSRIPVREWPAVEGRVLDAQTGQPIEGAFVVARWLGYGRFSDSQCFHVEVPETDAHGRYRIEAWRNEADSAYLSDQRRTIVRVHKPGYRESPITQERESYLQGMYYLEKDERGVAERLEYLTRTAVGCAEAGDDQKKLISLYRHLYDEAKDIAKDEEDGRKVETLRFGLESLEIGSVPALDRMIERRKARNE